MMSSTINRAKRMIRHIINGLGYQIYKNPRPGGRYEIVRPSAQYAPWTEDSLFLDTYETIRRYTLVDKYRCYELWSLVEQSSKLEGALIEVGVWRGGTGAIIAKKAELLGITDTVYLCDTFTGIVKAGAQDSTYKGGEYADTSQNIVEKLLCKRLQLGNAKVLGGVFPDQTSHLLIGEKFRFCHIDVDVYDSAKDIVDWIWDKW